LIRVWDRLEGTNEIQLNAILRFSLAVRVKLMRRERYFIAGFHGSEMCGGKKSMQLFLLPSLAQLKLKIYSDPMGTTFASAEVLAVKTDY
jgi:hypothetical protein